MNQLCRVQGSSIYYDLEMLEMSSDFFLLSLRFLSFLFAGFLLLCGVLFFGGYLFSFCLDGALALLLNAIFKAAL